MSKRKSGADEAPADGACALQPPPSAPLPLTRLPAATLGAVSAAGLDAVLSRAHAKRGRTAAAPERHAALPAPRASLAATTLGACGAPAQSRAGYEAEGELRPSDEERCDGAAPRARTRHAR